MKRLGIAPAVLALVIVGAACEDTPTVPLTPTFEISDGAHGGNPHFYWLPPIVPKPNFTGIFDATRSPVVLICEWDGMVCTNVIAEFTMLTGPGSETVRVVPEDEHYIVNWHTHEFDLNPDLLYRIAASADGFLLGTAGVDVVSTGGELKNVDTGEYIPLVDGKTLSILFRIEDDAIASNQSPTASIDNPPGDITITLGDAVDFQGTASDPDGTVASHSWDFGDGNVAAVEDPGPHTYAATGAFTVTYFVIDDDGASSTPDMVVVTVEEPPSFTASSVQLDGVDDVVDMTTAHEIVTAEAFSLSIWYRATVTGEGHLIGKQNPGDLRRGYFIHTDGSGNVCFSMVANENSLRQRECTTTAPALGEWHHVVATVAEGSRSFATTKIYVDGVEATTNAIGENMLNSSFANSGGNFTVGAALCSPGAGCGDIDGNPVPLSRAFQGFVDEAAIYRELELTAAQVAEIYNGGSPPDLTALLSTPLADSWWRMGECTDLAQTLVCDDGVNSLDGTLLNGAVFSTEVP